MTNETRIDVTAYLTDATCLVTGEDILVEHETAQALAMLHEMLREDDESELWEQAEYEDEKAIWRDDLAAEYPEGWARI